MEAFKELHGRSLFLCQRRYEESGALSDKKPDGTISYLHHRNIPFKKEAETDTDSASFN